MDSTGDPKHWWAERVQDSAEKLVRILREELHDELEGVPFPIARHIHNFAVFELLRVVNTNQIPSNLQETYRDQLVDFLSDEHSVFEALCDRIVQWTPREKKRGGGYGETLPFRQNPHLN